MTLGTERREEGAGTYLRNSLIFELPQGLSCRLSDMQKVQVRSLGWEDPLEEGMAADTSFLA